MLTVYVIFSGNRVVKEEFRDGFVGDVATALSTLQVKAEVRTRFCCQ